MKRLTVLSVVVASLLLVGCGDEPKEVAKEAVTPVEKKSVEEKSVVEKATEVVKETAKEVTTATKEAASTVAEKTTEVAKDAEKAADAVVESTKESVAAVAEKTTEVAKNAKDTKDAVVEKVTEVKDAVTKKVADATATVATIDVKSCAGCHGADFEKKAMNVSKIVKDMSKADIIVALKGYKDGSYGGNMKALMKGQVASYDDAKIEAVAAQIAK